MKKLAVLFFLALAGCASRGDGTVRLIAFSDYHSHAVPLYSEGKFSQAGIARAIAYLKDAKKQPNTAVVSGGDMLNAGTPAWSDEYTCAEWPWFNGLVDVMALGNHDLDYGADAFQKCKASISYPIISGNLMGPDGNPFFLPGGKPYVVKELGGLKVGFFSLGGRDFQQLVKKTNLPPGTSWADVLTQARATVQALRETEKVNAVVFVGHQLREDDEAMARAVPGIDLILGTHSHYKGELTRIEGTQTWFISPFQYLTYLSQVQLRFKHSQLVEVTGGLVKMDETVNEDIDTYNQVAQMQQQLRLKRPERFVVLGQAAVELSDAHLDTGESVIGNWATEVLRQAGGTHAFFSTASSFRAALPPGDITVEAFYAAVPYKNVIARADITGQQLAAWISYSVAKLGTDSFSQQSGVRYRVVDGHPVDIQVLKDPAHPAAGYAPLDPGATYKLGTTDFQGYIAAGYRDLFAAGANQEKTTLDAQAALIAAIQAGPISAALDGRDGP